jgi:predicted HTH domain antitoxin
MLLSNYQKNSFYPFLPLSSCGVTKKRIVNESRKLLALKYFQDKLLLLGKAAELAGLSKWDFIEYLSENHVPVIDYDDDELTREFKTAKTLDS